MKNKPKFRVGQVVYGWGSVQLFKIAERFYVDDDGDFYSWWYKDDYGQDFSERGLRSLTDREIGVRPRKRWGVHGKW